MDNYRRTGRTTRIIDNAIQTFFKEGSVITSDHHYPNSMLLARMISDRIINRLSIEHRLNASYQIVPPGIVFIAKDRVTLQSIISDYKRQNKP